MNRTTASTLRGTAIRTWVLLVAMALVLGACGSGGDDAASQVAAGQPLAEAAQPEATTTTEPATPPTTEAPAATTTTEPATPPTTEAPAATTTTPPVPGGETIGPGPDSEAAPEPDPEPPADEPEDVLLTAAEEALDALFDAATARIQGEVSGEGTDVTFEGVMDLPDRVFQGEVAFDGEPAIGLAIAGTDSYLALPDLPMGATWLLIEPDPSGGNPPSTAPDLPFGFLVALEAASGEEPVVDLGAQAGEEPEQRLRLTIDVDRLLTGAGIQPLWFGAWSADQLYAFADVDIADGHLARVALVVEPARGSDEHRDELRFEAVFEFSDIGATPAVAAPAAADVATDDDYGVPFGQLQVGDCYIDNSFGGPLYGVEVTPCDEPHQAEVFVIGQLPAELGDPWPGEGAVWEDVADACLAEFEDYVGEPYATSNLDFWGVYPVEEGWSAGDRLFVCSLVPMDGTPLDGSVRDGEF